MHQSVRQLYKELLFIGREYPKGTMTLEPTPSSLGYQYFRTGLKRAFMKKKDITDEKEIEKAVKHGQFVFKELEALWFLKKYRTMKRLYYDEKPKEVEVLDQKDRQIL